MSTSRVVASLMEAALLAVVWLWAGWRAVVCAVVVSVVVGVNRWRLGPRHVRVVTRA